MKRFLFAAFAGFALMTGSALAADLGLPFKAPPAPSSPAFSWAGAYVGVNGGWADANTDWTYTTGGVANHHANGGLVGATIGYNWMLTPNILLGTETDWDWANITGSTSCPNPTFSCQSKITDFGTSRTRIGFAWDRVLLYGTGGLAWGDVNIQTVNLGGIAQACSMGGTSPTCGTKTDRIGWTAGLGAEVYVWKSVSAKIEWLHYDLGTDVFGVDNGLFVNAREHGDIIRGGLNYHFNLADFFSSR